MDSPFRFDPEKALEVILYIAQNARIPDIYHVGKILYFADQDHLESYGRFINGDYYCAMKDGAVPSGTYDIIKDVRNPERTPRFPRVPARESFSVKGYFIELFRNPDLTFFSKSDLQMLDKSIAENGGLSYSQLRNKSHDTAYDSADMNGEISTIEIAKMLKDSDAIIENLMECV